MSVSESPKRARIVGLRYPFWALLHCWKRIDLADEACDRAEERELRCWGKETGRVGRTVLDFRRDVIR